MNIMKEGDICWTELATPNVAAAKKFYGDMFGWKFTEKQTGDMIYTMIHSGDNEFGGMWQIDKEQANEVPPHWLSYILVDDMESALVKAESLGATIKMGKTAAGEHGWFALIIDPTQAHIAFWQCKQVDKKLDKALNETFPASDPTATY